MSKSANAGNDHESASARGRSIAATESRRRTEQLVDAIDHCAAAKDIADGLGDRFLAYLLAMAIQEARAAIRDSVAAPEGFGDYRQ